MGNVGAPLVMELSVSCMLPYMPENMFLANHY